MGKSHYVGCRIDTKLFNKISEHELNNSDLMRMAIQRYFRENEPNVKLDEFGVNQELINLLKSQISSLENDKIFLQQQNQALMTASIPLLGRIKMKLITGNNKP